MDAGQLRGGGCTRLDDGGPTSPTVVGHAGQHFGTRRTFRMTRWIDVLTEAGG
jgi:hypothetical protein